jgi:hypothetical protein
MMNAVRRCSPLLLLPLLAAAAAGGCATAGAKGEPATTLLDVPLPPARVLVPPPPPAQDPPADAGAAPADKGPGPVSGRKPQPVSRPASPKKEPVEPSPAAGAPVAPSPPAAQPPTLEQPQPGKPDATEGQVKATIAKAKSDLDKVDYKGLNPDGKAQYDTAKRFIDEANQALGQKNLVYALKVADKAAGLAAGLLGRDERPRP